MLTGKPFFSIHYDTEGCIYEIRVNDVPIDSDKEGGPMATTIPINEWMHTGKNVITLYLKPQKDAKDLIKYGQSYNTVKHKNNFLSAFFFEKYFVFF